MDNSQLIIKRAHALKKVRAFFDARQVFEVDTPLLTTFASVDTHIDLVEALPFSKTRYLITSPEYAMKRLLAAGAPDIYQLSHVFRDGEISLKHNPEFMMLEWYRKGFALNDLIEETIALFHQFLPHARVETCTYFQLFMQELGVDPWNDSLEALKDVAQANNIDTGPFNERDDLLNLILGTILEPRLQKKDFFILKEYPASQASLAIVTEGEAGPVGQRFEVYFRGVELANGYQELARAQELRTRFINSNVERVKLSKKQLPIDELFLGSLDELPACSGVAVGFDRLFMLSIEASSLSDAMLFPWNEI